MLNVREIRQRKGWSQVELARMANIGQAYLSGIETEAKDPSLKTLRKLANALGVKVGDLVD